MTDQELPASWVTTTLGSVTHPRGIKAKPSDLDTGTPFVGLENVEAHTMRLLAVGRTGDVKSSGSLFSQGDVLYGRLRPYLNKVLMPGFNGLASGEFIVFPSQEFLDNAYLRYFLNQWEFASFATLLNAGDRPRVDFGQLSDYPFPLPPLAEQRRIVAAIEQQLTRLDAAVTALKRVQVNLQRYRASVLKSACEGKLVPTEAALVRAEGRDYEHADRLLARILVERRARWAAQPKRRGRYKAPAPPDTSALPQLPEGWTWAKLPQLGELNRGKSKHRPRNDPRLLGGPYPFVQTGDIKKSRGLVTHHSQTYTDFGLLQSRLWPSGTLCITIAANIADTGILTYPACFPDSVVGFICDGDLVTTKFLEMFVRTEKDDLERFSPSTTQKNINLKTLSDLAIPLPPLDEQRRIVAEVERRLSVVHQAETAVETSLKRAERLRQSILKRAFSGQLVPQDPNDEPASVLLACIQAERAAAEAAAKAQRKPRRRRKPRTAAAKQLSLAKGTP